MVLTAERTDAARKAKYAVIDCDIHPNLATPDALDKYLPERWRKHRQSIGGRGGDGSHLPPPPAPPPPRHPPPPHRQQAGAVPAAFLHPPPSPSDT